MWQYFWHKGNAPSTPLTIEGACRYTPLSLHAPLPRNTYAPHPCALPAGLKTTSRYNSELQRPKQGGWAVNFNQHGRPRAATDQASERQNCPLAHVYKIRQEYGSYYIYWCISYVYIGVLLSVLYILPKPLIF